jgi:hypothetical protein
VKLPVFAATLLTMSSSASFASCHVDRFTHFFGSDTATSGVVTKGSTCKITFSPGRGAGYTSVTITEQAKHGHAATNGSVAYPEVTYRPQAGYKGQDVFVFTIVGAGKRLSGASNIRVTMDVQ